jgi:SAM-dependent methyltransferase
MRALGIDARQGYAQALPFDDEVFAAVVASEVLEHLSADDRATALAEIARVLRTGGVFVGSVPYRENLADNRAVCPSCGNVFHRWGHTQSFDREQLRTELGAFLDVWVCKPVAFVAWRDADGLRSFAKAGAKWLLGRLGEGIVSPSMVFVARKPDPAR